MYVLHSDIAAREHSVDLQSGFEVADGVGNRGGPERSVLDLRGRANNGNMHFN